MSQTWQTFNDVVGGDSVYASMLIQEERTNSLKSSFSGSVEPSSDQVIGQPFYDTDDGQLYVCYQTSPSAAWRKLFVAGVTTISTTDITDLNVTAAKLATYSFEEAKIKDLNVTAAKLATDSVEEAKIKDGAVSAAKLANDSVTTLKILDSSVTDAKLATDSVIASKIKDGAVTAAKLASNLGDWTIQAKSASYSAATNDFVVATVGTSWTLTLPAAPSSGNRIGAYALSVTGTSELTIDGNGKNIEGSSSVKMYVAGDRLELIYSGSEWVVIGGRLKPHICQISKYRFYAPSASSWGTIALDTTDHDVGQLQNVSSNRIDIRRSGLYRVGFNVEMGQVGPVYQVFRILKYGAALHDNQVLSHPSDYYSTGGSKTDLASLSWSRLFSLTAADYLELQIWGTVAGGSSPSTATDLNQAYLSVEERNL